MRRSVFTLLLSHLPGGRTPLPANFKCRLMQFVIKATQVDGQGRCQVSRKATGALRLLRWQPEEGLAGPGEAGQGPVGSQWRQRTSCIRQTCSPCCQGGELLWVTLIHSLSRRSPRATCMLSSVLGSGTRDRMAGPPYGSTPAREGASWDCCNREPHTQWLKERKYIILQC